MFRNIQVEVFHAFVVIVETHRRVGYRAKGTGMAVSTTSVVAMVTEWFIPRRPVVTRVNGAWTSGGVNFPTTQPMDSVSCAFVYVSR